MEEERFGHVPAKKPSEFCVQELNSIVPDDFDRVERPVSFINIKQKWSVSHQQLSGMLSIGGLVVESQCDMEDVMDTLKSKSLVNLLIYEIHRQYQLQQEFSKKGIVR